MIHFAFSIWKNTIRFNIMQDVEQENPAIKLNSKSFIFDYLTI